MGNASESKILTIIIPTYNNPSALCKNLKMLTNYFIDMQTAVDIVISDDGSSSENNLAVERFLAELQNPNIRYYYHENIGLEKNELLLIEKVNTKYAMLLGEDDYLPKKYLEKVFGYLNNYEIGAIFANFYAVREDGKKVNRGCRNRLRKDKIFTESNYKLMFLAHQMSGLVFRTEGLSDYYNENVSSNLYPQLSFVAYSIDKGVCVHITDCPFECTILNKKRFNYAVDDLTYDMLKNVVAIVKTKKERRKLLNYFLLRWSAKFCNLRSWTSPIEFFKRIDEYSLLTKGERRKIKATFVFSYFVAPFRIFYRFVILPIIGKMEQKKIGKLVEDSRYE